MKESKIHRIIVKFLNQEADINELEKLDAWLRNDKNIPTFNHFVRTQYLTSLSMTEYDVNKAKKLIDQKLKDTKRKRIFSIYRKMAIAASIVFFLGTSVFIWYGSEQTIEITDQVPISIKAGTNRAILTLENGNQVALEKGKKYQKGSTSSDGKQLIYTSEKETNDLKNELAYNSLTVPRGGQFFVKLSDGTQVWLNSDSKLKYPVKFQEGKARNVEVVYGEAYFRVSPSTEHNGASFNVLTKSQIVNVLGTEFNIKAYDGDDEIVTTLVEGKIRVEKGKKSKVLKPYQQSKIRHNADIIKILDIEDLSQEISWINGLITFNEQSLDEIMKILSRWYDVDVIFETAEQKRFVFTGILERTKSIENILKLIETTSEGQIKFEIEDKTITFK